mmetsp:Transcript_23812/g.65444  ORF Transcript_23812/g.65444 Transcript_23812/m.65444 type:complete len:382 (+) Transcript_23812:92-1237(+)
MDSRIPLLCCGDTRFSSPSIKKHICACTRCCPSCTWMYCCIPIGSLCPWMSRCGLPSVPPFLLTSFCAASASNSVSNTHTSNRCEDRAGVRIRSAIQGVGAVTAAVAVAFAADVLVLTAAAGAMAYTSIPAPCAAFGAAAAPAILHLLSATAIATEPSAAAAFQGVAAAVAAAIATLKRAAVGAGSIRQSGGRQGYMQGSRDGEPRFCCHRSTFLEGLQSSVTLAQERQQLRQALPAAQGALQHFRLCAPCKPLPRICCTSFLLQQDPTGVAQEPVVAVKGLHHHQRLLCLRPPAMPQVVYSKGMQQLRLCRQSVRLGQLLRVGSGRCCGLCHTCGVLQLLRAGSGRCCGLCYICGMLQLLGSSRGVFGVLRLLRKCTFTS